MTTDGLPGFPRDELLEKWQFEEDRFRREQARERARAATVPPVSTPSKCDGDDLPGVRDRPAHESAVIRGNRDHWAGYVDYPSNTVTVPPASLKEQARQLVEGERQRDYGEPTSHMRRVAEAWTAVVGRPFTAEEVALCLATLKLVREGYRAKRDNREDAVGYLDILERLHADGA